MTEAQPGGVSAADVYQGFIEALNRQDLAGAERFVRVEDGLIVERVQQTDVLNQMRQLYGKATGVVGLAAMVWRL